VTDNVRLTVLTPRWLHTAAKEKAEALDLTVSQAVRWWLRAWVAGELEAEPPQAEQGEP